MGENTFCGGGFSCIAWEPQNPALVGRVVPTQLRSVVTTARATVGSHGVRVPLACEGGDAWNHCRGRVAVKVGSRKIATARYSLEADQAQRFLVPFAPGIKSPLGTRRSIAASVAVVATSGKGSSQKVSLKRSAPPKG
jgi:hypothetical protein